MDDFDQRLSARVGCLGIQPSLLAKLLTMTRSVLQESVQSCQKGDKNLDSQHSQLTATQPQLSQSGLYAGPQLAGMANNMLEGFDDQLVAQMLSDPSFGISHAGFWNTL
jgi:hypothetical protein